MSADVRGEAADTSAWRRFIAVLLAVTAAVIISAAAFVAIVDPYDSLAFSPRWKRHRVTTNERYAFPGLIRHGRFDSAVFGTSTMMLLQPAELDERLGGRFANLAMSYGTAWEQAQMMKFFAAHTPVPVRAVVVGMDMDWCSPKVPLAELTPHPFPPWEYDDDPFNDYAHLLNTRALLHSVRQALTLAHLVRPEFQDDGYYRFTPDDSRYDAERARRTIYENAPVTPPLDPRAEPPAPGSRPADWTFPDLALLGQALDALPAPTRKILVFVPIHISVLLDGSQWSQFSHCKEAVVELAEKRRDVTVLDMMRPSPLTRNDEAYWDTVHYRVRHASDIIDAIGSAVDDGQESGPLFEVLWPGRPHAG
ncbi:MAG: hypothetical protein JO228_07340 [Xanthobacteraceae bacterium]|nr:hypothetical protein [Xanthobacteraceae bacterium]